MGIGIKIKRYMNTNGISQAWLSNRSGIPVVALNMSLNDKRKFSLDEYEHICWALGLDVATFLTPTPPIMVAERV